MFSVCYLLPPSLGFAQGSPKNVILMIGDGMGPQQVGLLALYAQVQRERGQDITRLNTFRSLLHTGTLGIVQPKPPSSLVVDSACASTELASGVEALPQTLGFDVNGQRVLSVLRRAAHLGKSTGLVSDTRLTHATPAGFYANVVDRDDENVIAEQAIESGADIMLSGGLRHFLPQAVTPQILKEYGIPADKVRGLRSVRIDQKDLLGNARERGYELVFDRIGLSRASGPKILGLFAYSSMQNAMKEQRDPADKASLEPSLREMSMRALDVLATNPKGFFLMIEGGQIDWAGHANDAGWLLAEMRRFADALDGVREWMRDREDTLLIVTADHETGSFGFSYHANSIPTPVPFPGMPKGVLFSPTYNFVPEAVLDQLATQAGPLGKIFEELTRRSAGEGSSPYLLKALVRKNTGYEISVDEAAKVLRTQDNHYRVRGHRELGDAQVPEILDFDAFYSRPADRQIAALARVLARQTGVTWGTGAHTSTPVYVIAQGPGAEKFKGLHSQADVGALLQSISAEPK